MCGIAGSITKFYSNLISSDVKFIKSQRSDLEKIVIREREK